MRFYNFILLLMLNCINCFNEQIDLEVQEKLPYILTKNLNITTYVNETVVLPCKIANLQNHHVNWLKINNGTPITLTVGYQQFSRNLRYRVTRIHDSHSSEKTESWNFEIRRATIEDQGVFECYIKLNGKQKIKTNIFLVVLCKNESNNSESSYSKDFSHRHENNISRSVRLSSNLVEKIDTSSNSWVKLRCNASLMTSKRNSFDIHWFKDGKLIEQDSRRLKKWISSYDDSNFMELDIYAIDAEDSGVYQCRRDKTILKNVILRVLNNALNDIEDNSTVSEKIDSSNATQT